MSTTVAVPEPQTVVTPAGDRIRLVVAGVEHNQTFEAADYKELSEKLTKALAHANKFIDRLSKENKDMHGLLKASTHYLESLSRLRGNAADAELEQLTKIIQQRQSISAA
jgi:light-regulated signal transduction histidine kinase (bacteriophytochrome)